LEKPIWEDDVDISDLYPEEVQEEEDAYDPSQPISKPKKSKKEKKKAKKVKQKNDNHDKDALEEETGSDIDLDSNDEKAMAQDLDEYYNLDYEDLVNLI